MTKSSSDAKAHLGHTELNGDKYRGKCKSVWSQTSHYKETIPIMQKTLNIIPLQQRRKSKICFEQIVQL